MCFPLCFPNVQQASSGGRTAKVAKQPANNAIAVTAIRNLGEESWLKSLEIEVRNISSVPFLLVLVVLPDVKRTAPNGALVPQVIVLTYGQEDLRDERPATAEDLPINPGERYVFKIPENDRNALESELANGIVTELSLKRIFISVDTVSFGDGTGFSPGRPFTTKRHSGYSGTVRSYRPQSDYCGFETPLALFGG
jgi:hypothetical protein